MAETNFLAMQLMALTKVYQTDGVIPGIYFCTPEEAYGTDVPGPPLIMFSSENISEVGGFEQYVAQSTILRWLDEYPISQGYTVAHIDHLYQTLVELDATEPEMYHRFKV